MTKNGAVLNFFYDGEGRPAYFTYNNTTYYYVTNLQGDVIAILDSTGAVMVNYHYDAYGVLLQTGGTMATTLGTLNPLTYRGYVYDHETGLYYLQSRYYNPSIRQFISADTTAVLTANLMSVSNKNLFAYCDNNPVVRIDTEGYFWDTFFDVISFCASVVEVCVNPTDPWAWAGLAGDAVDLIPFVTGVGEATRAVKAIDRVTDAVDTTYDVVKTANRTENIINTTTDGIKYTDKVLKQMDNAADLNHAFPRIIDTFVDLNSGEPLVSGDHIPRRIIKLHGWINDTPGVFEYIIEPNGMCNHRYFKNLR